MKNENTLITIVAIILVLFLVGGFGMMGFGSMMGGTYNIMSGSYGIGGMFFGWLIGLLIVIVLVLVSIWLIKQIQDK